VRGRKMLCHRDVTMMPFDWFGCWVFQPPRHQDNNRSLRNMGFCQQSRVFSRNVVKIS
jgi:hypothetical protein